MRSTQGYLTIMFIYATFLSGCATQAPTEHYWDATSMTWHDSLPKAQRELKTFQKWGFSNSDLDEFREKEAQERWARERYQRRDEEARQ